MADNEKPPKDIVSVEEVCDLLGPPKAKIYRLAYSDPDFPKPFKTGRRLFWVREEVLAHRKRKQAEFAERHRPRSAEEQARKKAEQLLLARCAREFRASMVARRKR